MQVCFSMVVGRMQKVKGPVSGEQPSATDNEETMYSVNHSLTPKVKGEPCNHGVIVEVCWHGQCG